MTLRAVVFDWGGTLTGSHDVDLRAEWVAFADGYGTLACARDELAGRLLVAADAVWERSRTVPTHASGRLAEVFAAVGLDIEGDEPATQAGLAAWREYWLPYTLTHPGAGALLEALRDRGLRTGLLSNTLLSGAEHHGFLERDGVAHLFDAMLFSSELPVAKPHPDAFVAAAEALGCVPGECAYVGDRLYQDIAGAQGAGMRAILVERPGPGASFLPEDVPVPVPDAVVRDVTDVFDIVTHWQEAEA